MDPILDDELKRSRRMKQYQQYQDHLDKLDEVDKKGALNQAVKCKVKSKENCRRKFSNRNVFRSIKKTSL